MWSGLHSIDAKYNYRAEFVMCKRFIPPLILRYIFPLPCTKFDLNIDKLGFFTTK